MLSYKVRRRWIGDFHVECKYLVRACCCWCCCSPPLLQLLFTGCSLVSEGGGEAPLLLYHLRPSPQVSHKKDTRYSRLIKLFNNIISLMMQLLPHRSNSFVVMIILPANTFFIQVAANISGHTQAGGALFI